MSQNDVGGVAEDGILEADDEAGQESVVLHQPGHDRTQIWSSPEHTREE